VSEPLPKGTATRRGTALALAALLLLALALRLTGLSWGLRHTPEVDERYFVESTALMLERGDLDHRFHEYPGLFFYMLAPALAPLEPPRTGPEAYLTARTVVALLGVLNVALAFLLGRRLAGDAAGLMAAALLAMSPLEIQTAHQVRPDVALGVLATLALLAFTGVGTSRRQDLVCGLAVGAAMAVKFSGVLLVPPYVVTRLLRGGERWKGLLASGAGALVAFCVLSPYSLLRFPDLLEGIRIQTSYHYAPANTAPTPFPEMAAVYLGSLARGFGWSGLLLAAAGAAWAWRGFPRFGALMLLPPLALTFFATSDVKHDRFLLLSTSSIAALAGLALARVGRRSGGAAALIAIGVLLPSASRSLEYVQAIRRPSTADQVVDWAAAQLPAGSRILTLLPELGFDRARFEVEELRNPVQAPYWDALVALDRSGWRAGYDTLLAALPASRYSGSPLFVLRAPSSLRPALRRLDLRRCRLSASDAEPALPLLRDGDPATHWATLDRQRPGDRVRVLFDEAASVARVEISQGSRPDAFPAALDLLVTEDGSTWRNARTFEGRAPAEQQSRDGELSRILILEPRRLQGIELVETGRKRQPWAIAELRIDALASP
jgi:4-amino-4-deoxy-L-arabinose transferase-like glycosyltransferase